jgi:hypothetical protein
MEQKTMPDTIKEQHPPLERIAYTTREATEVGRTVYRHDLSCNQARQITRIETSAAQANPSLRARTLFVRRTGNYYAPSCRLTDA